MKIRTLLATACLLALAVSACAGGSAETGTGAQTTPAAAAGEPTTPAEPAVPAAAAPAPAPAAEAAPATPAANTAQPVAPQMPTLAAVVTHKVKDYDAWKKAFDGHVDARKAAGIVGEGIMRDAANDKIVTIWLPATDIAKLKEFSTSKDLKDKMKEAGVEGKPSVILMNSLEQQMDPSKPATCAVMATVTVKDVEAFKKAINDGAQARTEASVVGLGLSQDADKKDVVYAFFPAADAAKLKAYLESKELKKAWKDAGVKGSAKLQFLSSMEKPTFYQQ